MGCQCWSMHLDDAMLIIANIAECSIVHFVLLSTNPNIWTFIKFTTNAKALPTGKTKWSTGPTVRNLMEADGNSTTKLDTADLKVVLQERVTSILPLALSPWCSFVGMTWCCAEYCCRWSQLYHYSAPLPYSKLQHNALLFDKYDKNISCIKQNWRYLLLCVFLL